MTGVQTCALPILPEPFVDITEERLDRILNLNVRAAFLVAQAAARKMLEATDRREHGGAMVNISSISALRPRGVRIPAASELPAEVTPGASMRVLFYADAVGRDRAAYRAVWDSLRMDNLTAELTDQLYTLSQINRQKYAALDRLYAGLMIMALLLGALIGTIALHQALQ
mgnify:CR=1 FL=1